MAVQKTYETYSAILNELSDFLQQTCSVRQIK